MRSLILVLIFSVGCLFAYEFVDTEASWLSASWTNDGDILLTSANYQGLYLLREDGRLDTITDDWKAGYEVAISDDGKIAFTGYTFIDGEGCVRQYYTEESYLEGAIHCAENLGPPTYDSYGDLVFSDGRQIFTYNGLQVESHIGGAYLVIPVANGFFWCDRAGIAYHSADGKIKEIPLTGQGRFTFAPIVSKDGNFVLFKEISGVQYLYNVVSEELLQMPKGDKPRFVEEPFGILQLQLIDDGKYITESRIEFVRLDDNPSPMPILEELWGYIINAIDYHPEHGFLLTTNDGRIIVEKAEVLTK